MRTVSKRYVLRCIIKRELFAASKRHGNVLKIRKNFLKYGNFLEIFPDDKIRPIRPGSGVLR